MDVRKMTIDELELLSFTDIAYNLIKMDKKPKTTVELFKEICSLLNLSDKEYEEKIADFFTSLTTDKRFILLDSINWDLRENHSSTIELESEDEYDDIEDELEEIVNEEEEDSKDFTEDEYDDIDEDDELDELEDLEITNEEDELEE